MWVVVGATPWRIGAVPVPSRSNFTPRLHPFSPLQLHAGFGGTSGWCTGHEVLPIVSQCARELSPPLCGAMEGPGAGSRSCCDLQPPSHPHRPPSLFSSHPRPLNTTTTAAVPTKDPAGPHCSAPTLPHSTGPTTHPWGPQTTIPLWATGISFHSGTGDIIPRRDVGTFLHWDMGEWEGGRSPARSCRHDDSLLSSLLSPLLLPQPHPTAPQTPCAELPIHHPTPHARSCQRAWRGAGGMRGGGFPPHLQPHVPLSVPPPQHPSPGAAPHPSARPAVSVCPPVGCRAVGAVPPARPHLAPIPWARGL